MNKTLGSLIKAPVPGFPLGRPWEAGELAPVTETRAALLLPASSPGPAHLASEPANKSSLPIKTKPEVC